MRSTEAGRSTTILLQHDPATYITFAKQFANLAATIDPSISIGLDVQSPGSDFNNWTADILQQSASQGLTVGFLSDHNYVQAPGSESDSNLLLDTVTGTNSDPSDPGNPYNWAARAADYESLPHQVPGCGRRARSSSSRPSSTRFIPSPGKQTTSLVNGLFLADSLGAMLETPYDGADVWDLRNSYSTGGNNSSSLYGWRTGGDYGLIGSPGGTAPATGPYVPYPTYFAEELASKIIQTGGNVVQASSSDPNLTAYAVARAQRPPRSAGHQQERSGRLDRPVPARQLHARGTGHGLAVRRGAGHGTEPNDRTAHRRWRISRPSLSVNGSTFSYSFPAYSMTVLDLGKASSGTAGPTITKAAAATPSPVTGKTTALSVAATDPAGNAGLTFTWATTGTPPAPVAFSANGTNAAANTTATFSKAGSYTLPGDRLRPGRLRCDQQRDGDGESDVELDQGQPGDGDAFRRGPAAVLGERSRPVRERR